MYHFSVSVKNLFKNKTNEGRVPGEEETQRLSQILAFPTIGNPSGIDEGIQLTLISSLCQHLVEFGIFGSILYHVSLASPYN